MPVQCRYSLHFNTFSFFIVDFVAAPNTARLYRSKICPWWRVSSREPSTVNLVQPSCWCRRSTLSWPTRGTVGWGLAPPPATRNQSGCLNYGKRGFHLHLISCHQSASQIKLGIQEGSMIPVVMEANCRVKTVYCLGWHETLPKRVLVWPSMLKQSPENLASIWEKKYKILFDCCQNVVRWKD